MMLMGGWGLVMPILAIFFNDKIKGGGVELAGLAMTVYYLVKSVAQIPIAKVIDGHRGEQDDFWLMVAGSFLTGLAAYLYMYASLPWHVYAIQVVHGLGGALCYPTWMAIFTRHVDKHREGWEWTFYYTTTDVGTALAAGLGGLLVAAYGYDVLFWVVGTCCMVGVFLLAMIIDEAKKGDR